MNELRLEPLLGGNVSYMLVGKTVVVQVEKQEKVTQIKTGKNKYSKLSFGSSHVKKIGNQTAT